MKREIALITGGTRGIGLGIAHALAKSGFDLVLCGMREASAVEESLQPLRELGAETLYVRCNVADRADRLAMLDSTRRHYGRLNVLVNNAGIAPRQRLDILQATEESYEEVMRTNLQGPYFLTQAAARWMIEQREGDPDWSGCIISVSSISATVASPNRGEYCISKAGISMATQLWAARLGEFGIPVYEVRPGVIATDMTAGVKAKYDALIAGGLCVQKRWGTPEDVGSAVAALAAGSFPYSTGQVILVDGGLTLSRL
jgi:NAD(P)-dependent dehydrogenase (short-subunit alcohol dehydrogenase family)